MALGAARSGVLGLVMRQGLTVTGVGLLAGARVLASFAASTLSGVLYGVSAADPAVWSSAAAVLLAMAAIADLVSARRASRVEPSVALRSD